VPEKSGTAGLRIGFFPDGEVSLVLLVLSTTIFQNFLVDEVLSPLGAFCLTGNSPRTRNGICGVFPNLTGFFGNAIKKQSIEIIISNIYTPSFPVEILQINGILR
jgi:hypothetical protein